MQGLNLFFVTVKTNNSSSRKSLNGEKIKPLNVLSAYSSNQSLCLYSKQIDDKTNEIPNISLVLDKLNIKNAVITRDVLNTQIKNVNKVISKGGDYVVPIKGNQGNFYNDLELYFNDNTLDEMRIGKTKSVYKKIIEKANSKVIIYEYFQTEDVSWYHKIDDWKNLKSFGVVLKTIDYNSKIATEKRYYISSLFNDIELFSRAIRNHWNIENKLHWYLDFTFRDDYNTTSNKKLLFNIQLIKKFCLGILEKIKDIYKVSLKRIRHIIELNVETEIPRLFEILNDKKYKKTE